MRSLIFVDGLPVVRDMTPDEVAEFEASRGIAHVPNLTFAQLLIGLVAQAWITEAEGDAWLAGTPPAAAMALVAQLPPEHRFAARARLVRPSTVDRGDALVNGLAALQGKTPAEMDAFFTAYAAS